MASAPRAVNVQTPKMQARRRLALAWQEHMLDEHDDWGPRELDTILDPDQLQTMHAATGCSFQAQPVSEAREREIGWNENHADPGAIDYHPWRCGANCEVCADR